MRHFVQVCICLTTANLRYHLLHRLIIIFIGFLIHWIVHIITKRQTIIRISNLGNIHITGSTNMSSTCSTKGNHTTRHSLHCCLTIAHHDVGGTLNHVEA